MARGIKASEAGQKRRNDRLLKGVKYLGKQVRSEVLPLMVDIGRQRALSREQVAELEALQGLTPGGGLCLQLELIREAA